MSKVHCDTTPAKNFTVRRGNSEEGFDGEGQEREKNGFARKNLRKKKGTQNNLNDKGKTRRRFSKRGMGKLEPWGGTITALKTGGGNRITHKDTKNPRAKGKLVSTDLQKRKNRQANP